MIELAAGRVESQQYLVARHVAGALDRIEHEVEGLRIGFGIRREAAFVTDCRVQTALLKQCFERLEDLGAAAQRLAKARHTDGQNHELLQIDVVVGVGAAVENVHQRHRQHTGRRTAEVSVQRHTSVFCGGMRCRHGHGEHGIGAQATLGRRAVEVDQELVEARLIERIRAQQG